MIAVAQIIAAAQFIQSYHYLFPRFSKKKHGSYKNKHCTFDLKGSLECKRSGYVIFGPK